MQGPELADSIIGGRLVGSSCKALPSWSGREEVTVSRLLSAGLGFGPENVTTWEVSHRHRGLEAGTDKPAWHTCDAAEVGVAHSLTWCFSQVFGEAHVDGVDSRGTMHES